MSFFWATDQLKEGGFPTSSDSAYRGIVDGIKIADKTLLLLQDWGSFTLFETKEYKGKRGTASSILARYRYHKTVKGKLFKTRMISPNEYTVQRIL